MNCQANLRPAPWFYGLEATAVQPSRSPSRFEIADVAWVNMGISTISLGKIWENEDFQ